MLMKIGILYFTTCFHGFAILRHVDPFVRMLHIYSQTKNMTTFSFNSFKFFFYFLLIMYIFFLKSLAGFWRPPPGGTRGQLPPCPPPRYATGKRVKCGSKKGGSCRRRTQHIPFQKRTLINLLRKYIHNDVSRGAEGGAAVMEGSVKILFLKKN